jgi:hypothetical protein
MPMDLLLANKTFDAETTQLLGSTFDATWERAKASDSLPTDKAHVRAKFIIAMSSKARKIPNDLLTMPYFVCELFYDMTP